MPARRAEIRKIRDGILAWYRVNRRVLRWRRTTDPYEILLSEVMLQQTQVERVRKFFPRFLRRFPTLKVLARARRSAVVREWKGMGYNNRAVRLHMAVREIEKKYGGRVPRDVEHLDALPGIGKYTAHAVACFGFGVNTPVVDVNIRRVISRLSRKMKSTSDLIPEGEAWNIAADMLPADASAWNQALMDLGAIVCTARAPGCLSCPVGESCPSFGLHKLRPSSPFPNGKPEPRFNGIPRRIWRGRIVDILREEKKGVSPGQLRRRLMNADDPGTEAFLTEVLDLLEADGVITLQRRRGRTGICLAE